MTEERGLRPLAGDEVALLQRLIGNQCRKAREELRLTQRALATRMDRSPSWVREVEGGAQWAPPYYLAALARATGHTIDWFYGDERIQNLADLILHRVREGIHVNCTLNGGNA